MHADELQISSNFMWQYFDSIPKIIKYWFGDNVSQIKHKNKKDKN